MPLLCLDSESYNLSNIKVESVAIILPYPDLVCHVTMEPSLAIDPLESTSYLQSRSREKKIRRNKDIIEKFEPDCDKGGLV